MTARELPSPVAAVLGCTTTFGSFGEFGALLECSAEVTGAPAGGVTSRWSCTSTASVSRRRARGGGWGSSAVPGMSRLRSPVAAAGRSPSP
ncbi:hypothetical protein [Nonomuraea rubra]|uniref:hypothetical protein n=1 Tax=Nonomuraea rubra TaxID=46180 RepID=UPI0031E82276